MTSDDGSGFGTEAAVAQTDGYKAQRQSLRHFLFAEIAFRSDQHQHISTLLHLVFQPPLVLFVAMRNEQLPLCTLYLVTLFFDKRVIRCQLVEDGQIRRQALFGGRKDDFLEAVGAQLLALGETAEQGRDLIHAYLHTFLDGPFEPLDILGRRYGYVQMESVMRLLFLAGQDLKVAVLGMRIGDTRRVGRSLTVRQQFRSEPIGLRRTWTGSPTFHPAFRI